MIFVDEIDSERYIKGYYFLESKKGVRDAAWNLAIGQSVGNPLVRLERETDELFFNHSCVVKNCPDLELFSGRVEIGFPVANIDFASDGIAQLLCFLMGGQLDIDTIETCWLEKLVIPDWVIEKYFKMPKYGITGARDFTNTHDKPLLGGICKPKTGISPSILLDMVKEMVEGGVNFIKEDEIMANPDVCPLEKRVSLISDYIRDKNVVYCFCINSDPAHILDRVKFVHQEGGNGIHINFWSGMGVYKSVRDLDLPLFMHFQKSGDKILTNKKHAFHIDWSVICYLAGLMGVDFIHTGMWGGYASDDENDLRNTMGILHSRNVVPALSCGMHPGIVNTITEKFGINYLANCGGALHGHPSGTVAGAKAMRQAIDKSFDVEYHEAISKWGIVE
jgi:ribulose-bisphosphate carboxylase large chain